MYNDYSHLIGFVQFKRFYGFKEDHEMTDFEKQTLINMYEP